MNRSQAEALTAKLAAAYPREWVGEASFAVYVERLERLHSFEQATRAVNALIDHERRLPSVADVRDEYRRHEQPLPALPEPAMTEAQRQQNLEVLRGLMARVDASMKARAKPVGMEKEGRLPSVLKELPGEDEAA